MTPFEVRLAFHGDLPFFLRGKRGTAANRQLKRTNIR